MVTTTLAVEPRPRLGCPAFGFGPSYDYPFTDFRQRILSAVGLARTSTEVIAVWFRWEILHVASQITTIHEP